MSKNVIFYFTGTGNSLKAAKDIASKLGDCDMFLMPAYKEKSIAAGYERVGFVFPVYAGGPPLCVQTISLCTICPKLFISYLQIIGEKLI